VIERVTLNVRLDQSAFGEPGRSGRRGQLPRNSRLRESAQGSDPG
jgi:hypothetical protein